ncbi:MAG: UDP-N-acetylmuramoyl-L-alanine--D-glutamate ligase [Candidatus Bipolaricaulota bacterium]
MTSAGEEPGGEVERLPFRKVTVIGFGRTGRAAAAELVRRGVEVFVSEARALRLRERSLLAGYGVRWEEEGHSEAALDAELLVLSPGVPPSGRVVNRARARGIPVWSELELAYRMCSPDRIVAITGTNGKSTTTALVGSILRGAGMCPVVAGNIGRPAVRSVERAEGRPWVLEVSSYQLELVSQFRPHVAVWLNFSPDHLLRHGSLAGYFAAKARVFSQQESCDVAVLPAELLVRLAPKARTVDPGSEELPPGWGKGFAEHQLVNLRAAWAAAAAAYPQIRGEPPPWDSVAPALCQPHRLETVGYWHGIPFVNDSKATNPCATVYALNGFKRPVVLILGGRPKRTGYDALQTPLRDRVRACVLLGEARSMFASCLESWDVPYVTADGTEQALASAYHAARPGDVVLLSPGCASFDMFEDYADRGRAFRRAFYRLREA